MGNDDRHATALPDGSEVRLLVVPASGLDKVRLETNVDAAVAKYGVTGNGVLVAVMDRGIDWLNSDFRNPDGTSVAASRPRRGSRGVGVGGPTGSPNDVGESIEMNRRARRAKTTTPMSGG